MVIPELEVRYARWNRVHGGLHIELRTGTHGAPNHPDVTISKSELVSLDYLPSSEEESEYIKIRIQQELPFMGDVTQSSWIGSPPRIVRQFHDVLVYDRALQDVYRFVERLHADLADQKVADELR